MADHNCKQCGGTGQVPSFTKIIPCVCNEKNTTATTTTKQQGIDATAGTAVVYTSGPAATMVKISQLGPGRREYAFVADDSGARGTRYIWEVYNCATNGMLERVEPASGQPDDFYHRFIYKFPFAGVFSVRLLVRRGTVTESIAVRITVH